ncbi:hypothetical protein H8Z72_22600 (plasmid) [Xanthomonas citri pv. citri]|uniref:hypothetical protein n=1 Tax=Xanthomonas citri TaxID=346 RepID=UPI00193207C1|nr:hypothetical protein [Xanthomonas citri]QRD62679.1 hypothetical protein H8Z74_23585 [Xanthomonas citri pv. citri]QRD67214.1 hypothetical protein H8Z73_22565 [Xanthomonas citri pv. citri]QRD71741.1 hypothetical protein H8Z72_22600 [Xanthomonas citri pv. citri]
MSTTNQQLSTGDDRFPNRMEGAVAYAEAMEAAAAALFEQLMRRKPDGRDSGLDLLAHVAAALAARQQDGAGRAETTLRELLAERNHRTDGDLLTLAERCLHLSRGDRDLIALRKTIIDRLKLRSVEKADVAGEPNGRIAPAASVELAEEIMRRLVVEGCMGTDGAVYRQLRALIESRRAVISDTRR